MSDKRSLPAGMASDADFSFTGYNHRHKEAARQLRRNMTPAEELLWREYCRKSRWKFYRQRCIDQFIVDFYCSTVKLVIEVDGAPHFTKDGLAYDHLRSEILERYHLTVLRFTNDQVMNDFQSVCATIERTIVQLLREEAERG